MHKLLQSESVQKIEDFIIKHCDCEFVASARILDYISVLSVCRDLHAKSFKSLLYEYISDEFGFVVFDLFEDTFVFCGSTAEDISELMNKVRTKVFTYGLSEMMLPVKIILRIGYSELKEIGNKSLLLKRSLFAMHSACASASDKNIRSCMITNDEIQKFRSRSLKSAYVYDAIRRDDFELGFQPIVDSKSGRVQYYECLLRISGNDMQFSISDCVQILEQEEFISFIDIKILQRAVKELEKSKKIKLGVNISANSVANETWTNACLQTLSSTPEANRLIIEITETAIKTDCKNIGNFLFDAKNIGCRFAIDDFGSGYNSIEHLAMFDIDFVKIDGNIINGIEKNSRHRFMVEILSKIAKEFNLQIIAECVESFGCVRMLEDIGISLMQGNYFSPVLRSKAWVSM